MSQEENNWASQKEEKNVFVFWNIQRLEQTVAMFFNR
jgi:hypothetical protein